LPTPVVVVDYDPAWPALFAKVSGSLSAMLGDTVREIHHVGSTAVQGLAAKPVIDIDVVLSGAGEITAACAAMLAAGYLPRGNRYDDDMWAFVTKAPPGCRVYLCPPENETHRKRLAFRDRLRRDGDLAAAYAALKRELATRYPLDGDAYTAAKAGFIEAAIAPHA